MLFALFSAVVKFHRAASPASFVREHLKNLLPRSRKNKEPKNNNNNNNVQNENNNQNQSETAATNGTTTTTTTSGAGTPAKSYEKKQRQQKTKSSRHSDASGSASGEGKRSGSNNGSRKKNKGSSSSSSNDDSHSEPAEHEKDHEPTHIYIMDMNSDFKAGSSSTFSIEGGVHAQFYLDCQLETRDRYRGWHGVYLCPDWPEPSNPDAPLAFEALPALVSFRLTLTARDQVLWKYRSDPIVFLATDTGWGQCRAVRSSLLRGHRSAVITCHTKSSAVFRLCVAYLYKNFESVDPEVLAGLDPRTLRSLICTRWPAHKNGAAARRLDALCGKLADKSWEWADLRKSLAAKDRELAELHERVKALQEEKKVESGLGEGVVLIRETLRGLPKDARAVIKLPFGIAYVPRAALKEFDDANRSNPEAVGSSREASIDVACKQKLVAEEKKSSEKKIGGLFTEPLSIPGGAPISPVGIGLGPLDGPN